MRCAPQLFTSWMCKLSDSKMSHALRSPLLKNFSRQIHAQILMLAGMFTQFRLVMPCFAQDVSGCRRLKSLWAHGRSRQRLDVGGPHFKQVDAIAACAQCLVQLLRVGDAPSALAALIMAALASDHHNWTPTFIHAGCLVPLATMLGGPVEQVRRQASSAAHA